MLDMQGYLVGIMCELTTEEVLEGAVPNQFSHAVPARYLDGF